MYVFRYNSVDICVAVSTDSGLITPIVFNADSKVNITLMHFSFKCISTPVFSTKIRVRKSNILNKIIMVVKNYLIYVELLII